MKRINSSKVSRGPAPKLASQDSQFVDELAEGIGISRKACLQLLMRELDPDFPEDTIPSKLDRGSFVALNLFDRNGDIELDSIPGLQRLSRLQQLNLGKTFIRVLDVSGNASLRHLRLGNPDYSQCFELFIADNPALEKIDGGIGFAWTEIYCTDAQKKRFFGRARKGIFPIPESSLERHRVAARHNWDDGLHLLKWMSRMSSTDAGTALMIYWKGAPGWFRQYAKRAKVRGHELENFDLVREIEERYLSGFYREARILFNPRSDKTTGSKTGEDWTARYSDCKVARPIPARMYEPSLTR